METTQGFSTALLPGSEIIVNIALPQAGSKSTAVDLRFNAAGEQVDFQGQPVDGAELFFADGAIQAPINFDLSAYTEAVKANDLERQAQITLAHREAVRAQRDNGGGTPAEIVGNAVYALLQAEYGVLPNDHEGPVLARSDLLVKAPLSQPGTFIVQAAPRWGNDGAF